MQSRDADQGSKRGRCKPGGKRAASTAISPIVQEKSRIVSSIQLHSFDSTPERRGHAALGCAGGRWVLGNRGLPGAWEQQAALRPESSAANVDGVLRCPAAASADRRTCRHPARRRAQRPCSRCRAEPWASRPTASAGPRSAPASCWRCAPCSPSMPCTARCICVAPTLCGDVEGPNRAVGCRRALNPPLPPSIPSLHHPCARCPATTCWIAAGAASAWRWWRGGAGLAGLSQPVLLAAKVPSPTLLAAHMRPCWEQLGGRATSP